MRHKLVLCDFCLNIHIYGLYIIFMGRAATIKIFQKLKMIPGKYTRRGCLTLNNHRIYFGR